MCVCVCVLPIYFGESLSDHGETCALQRVRTTICRVQSVGPQLRTSYIGRGSVLIGCPNPSTSSYLPSSWFVVHSSPGRGGLVHISTSFAILSAVNPLFFVEDTVLLQPPRALDGAPSLLRNGVARLHVCFDCLEVTVKSQTPTFFVPTLQVCQALSVSHGIRDCTGT